jgi:putative aldouronate transport system permease protein
MALYAGLKLGKHRKKSDPFGIAVGIILTLWALIIVLPFFNVIAVSLSTEKEYLLSAYMFFPSKPTLNNYAKLLEDTRIFTGYRTTLLFVIIGVPYNMMLTICTAYALSKPFFPGKRFFLYVVIFTMYFGGGIVPMYLLMRDLQLTNTIWAVILPYGVNTFYMLIMRNYFIAVPPSISESARIDGAGEWRILFRIVLPLSQPILATFALFFAVDRWNEWYNSMIFIKSIQITPLQLILRSIVLASEYVPTVAKGSAAAMGAIFSKGLKMAAVIITMAPIMLVYPFVQKYFVKGITIGAVKA